MPHSVSRGSLRIDQAGQALPQGKATFEATKPLRTKVKEASDVTSLPGARLAVVGDESDELSVIDSRGNITKFKLEGLPDGRSDLEAVTYDPARKHLIVVREAKRELLRYEWDPESGKKPKLEKRIRLDPGDGSNKGIEGIVYLSGDASPTGKPQLLAGKEGRPKELLILPDGGGDGQWKEVKLDDAIREKCKDFSGVTVDPRTGNIFITSDESEAVVQLKLVNRGGKIHGEFVNHFALTDHKGKPIKRAEGLAFNEKGDMFVLSENTGDLHFLKRKR